MVLVQREHNHNDGSLAGGFLPANPGRTHRRRIGAGDTDKPFLEEINRRVTTHMADFHFAPTELSCKNLLREGVNDERILITGNTVVDALHYIANVEALAPRTVPEALDGKRLILVTPRRRESLARVSAKYVKLCFAFA